MIDIKSILIKESVSKEKAFNEWPVEKREASLSKDLVEWTQRDFALYISDLYYKKFSKPIGFGIIGMSAYLGRIKVNVKEAVGFCDNIVLKDYIDYYFKNWIEHHISDWKDKFGKYMQYSKPLI